MYIQVTNRCNMSCRHCIFDCKVKGQDMPLNIFQKAVEIASDFDSYITIGGGEPTLHPDILWMLGYATMVSEYPIFMVTNGTCSKKTWDILLRANKFKNLDVRVSRSIWHNTNKIQDWVWEDCDRYKLWWGEDREILTLVNKGRAKENLKQLKDEAYNHFEKVIIEDCDCLTPRIDPLGKVWIDLPESICVGELSEDTISKAYEIITEYEQD